jgi:MscS family membrane protein
MFDVIYYGNTVIDWMIAVFIISAFIILAKSISWILKNKISVIVKKSRFKLDDILLRIVEKPISLTIIILGVSVSLNSLNLEKSWQKYVDYGTYVALTITIAWVLTRFIDVLFQAILTPMAKKTSATLDDQLLPIARKTLKIAVWSVAILVALDNAGYDIGALLAGLGLGGLALAMAAKDTIANLFGGITIFIGRPFEVGDRITSNGFDGVVEEIGIRSTKLKTLAGRIVTLSNADVANNAIENISSEPSRKIVHNIGLTYETTPQQIEKARDILQEICLQNENVENNVITSFDNFGDFSLNINHIYYIKPGCSIANTKSQINVEILKRFNAEKLHMAYPTQKILLQR